MENKESINYKKWVMSLLDEIEKVNRMIELSQQHKDDLATVQYEDVKSRFLSELKGVLFDLKIEADLRLVA